MVWRLAPPSRRPDELEKVNCSWCHLISGQSRNAELLLSPSYGGFGFDLLFLRLQQIRKRTTCQAKIQDGHKPVKTIVESDGSELQESNFRLCSCVILRRSILITPLLCPLGKPQRSRTPGGSTARPGSPAPRPGTAWVPSSRAASLPEIASGASSDAMCLPASPQAGTRPQWLSGS